MNLIEFNVGCIYESVELDKYQHHGHMRMYEVVSKSARTITFKDVNSQEITTCDFHAERDLFRTVEIAYPYGFGFSHDSPVVRATDKITLTIFMDNAVALKTYTAYDINGENGCFVHTGSNKFVLHYTDNLNRCSDQYVLVTNVETFLDAKYFLTFLLNGYADVWYGYDLEAFLWIKQNGLPVCIESEDAYLNQLRAK